MKIVSLFSGIGAYEKALSNLGINYEVEAYCELDSKTSTCYSIIHDINENKNLIDVKKINPININDFDLLVYSPPCQDISTAGQHAGISSNTRTGLMWNVIDIIKIKKPKYLVMENVKNLAKKYKNILDEYVRTLESIGYKCKYEVLNAKDYGTPQNRQRLFLVGVRNDVENDFQIPTKRPLDCSLKDFLVDVDAKTIDKEIAYTIRLGGRKSKVGNKHNWDGYIVNGEEYYLTSKDCLALMGFEESDYLKLKSAGISESKIAKVAGNSVVVSVAESIFKNLGLA